MKKLLYIVILPSVLIAMERQVTIDVSERLVHAEQASDDLRSTLSKLKGIDDSLRHILIKYLYSNTNDNDCEKIRTLLDDIHAQHAADDSISNIQLVRQSVQGLELEALKIQNQQHEKEFYNIYKKFLYHSVFLAAITMFMWWEIIFHH